MNTWNTNWIGNFGVWLADRFEPRKCTKAEIAAMSQYAELMVNVLRGTCEHYGRDCEKDHKPFVSGL